MTIPQGRGAPPLDQAAIESVAAAQGRPRRPPPGYEPHPMTGAEKAEARHAAADEACGLCNGYHRLPSTVACPRVQSAELDRDGKILRVAFWPGVKWARGRVVFHEDTTEGDQDEGDGER